MEENEEIDSLFEDDATDQTPEEQPAPPEPEQTAETPEEPVEQTAEQPSEETKEPDKEETTQADSEVPKEPEQQQEQHRVPLPELLSERKARQAAEQKAEESKEQLFQLQNQLTQIQTALAAQQQPQGEPEPYDFITDPEAAQQQVVNTINQSVSQRVGALSYNYAVRTHGQEQVHEAIRAAQLAGIDNQLADKPDPFHSLMEWHKEQTLLKETGGDLQGYREKLEAEIRAKVVDELKGQGVNPVANAGEQKASPPPTLADVGAPTIGAEPIKSEQEVFDDIF